MEANIYVILPPKCNESSQRSKAKLFLQDDSYVVTSL